MTDKAKNRQRIQATVTFDTYDIVSLISETRCISRGKALDVIVSEWETNRLDEQNKANTGNHDLNVIKNTVDSIDRRLSRIEQNIMTNGSILAK